MIYIYNILLITFFTLFISSIYVSFNSFSVYSQNDGDDGFFTVPEDEFYDPNDYSTKKPPSSLESENSSESTTIYKENSEQFRDPKNYSDFKFAVVGDWGCTKNTVKTVDLIHNQNPDIVFSLGDTSYQQNINCWIDIVNPILDKIKAVIGNHDVMSPYLFEQHIETLGLDKPYYSFDYNNIHFLMMDSEASYLPGSDPSFTDIKNTDEYQFVENDLSEASKNQNIKWIIVMSHRQFYSSHCGSHDSCEPTKTLRDTYHPLFEKYGVDILFSGHAHNYERTYPLFYNDVNPSKPIIRDVIQTTEYLSPKGMFQIIVGTGGIDHDPFSNQEPFVVYQQDSSYGFVNVDVTDHGNILTGKYYNNDDNVLDEFTIIK